MTQTTAPQTTEPVAHVLVGRSTHPAPLAPVVNPALTSETVGWTAMGTAADADLAVRTAHRAFPRWSALTPAERGAYLVDAAAALDPSGEERARLLVREQGKVLWEARMETSRVGDMLRYYASLAEEVAAEKVTDDARGSLRVRRRPMGVTAIIVPWNAPVYLAFLAVAPALMAGNPIVVKPSELAPLALTETLTTLAAVLPEGVVNVVPGDGAVVGAALSAHPLVRKVLFTGSTATGQAVMRAAAGTVKNVGLELGGNDPAIVLESARITDQLIGELVKGVYTGTGQICFNVKRIYVHESRYREFLSAFTAAVDEIVVGSGLHPEATMGPLNNDPQRRRVEELVAGARSSGADVATVGRKLDPATWDSGYFMLPSVVSGLSDDADLVRCEQFGPTVPVLPFRDEDDVVARANDSEFGLAASLWTEDVDHAFELSRRIESGTVFVNVHRLGASDITMPFGGMKRSGIGRNHGIVAIEGCMEMQVVAHRVDHERLPGPHLYGQGES
jgi:aldehyde dehydrogenase